MRRKSRDENAGRQEAPGPERDARPPKPPKPGKPGKPRLADLDQEEEGSQLADVPASEGKSLKLDWLWPDRLEWGSVAVVQGTKGAGKSTWMRAIAAAVTGGPPLPGTERRKRVVGSVLWYAGEEPLWSRVRPGLEAAGADLSRIYLADALGETRDMLQLPNDCPRLAERIRLRSAKLVVIDPLFAFTDGSCELEGPTVPARRFMREIMRVASASGALILLARNNTKATGNGALAAGRGSGEIGNAARSVLHLTPLPDNTATYVLSVAACNNGAPVPGITYTLVTHLGASKIQLVGSTPMTADELTDGDEGSLDRLQIEHAKELLRRLLTDSELDSKIVKAKADQEMIATRTLQKAANALGVRVRRDGSGATTVSFWRAPVGGFGGGSARDGATARLKKPAKPGRKPRK
jgi:putative DNA primase/helicase